MCLEMQGQKTGGQSASQNCKGGQNSGLLIISSVLSEYFIHVIITKHQVIA